MKVDALSLSRLSLSRLSLPPGEAASADPARAGIEAASRDFEAMFLAQMLQPMFAGLETDGPFGGGPGEAAFRDLLVSEYAREMSKSTRLGIAEAMTRTLLAAQEGPPSPAPSPTSPHSPERSAP